MSLEIRGISKTYANGVQALRAIDLDIKPGMFGLLGPNGAGKSSLMRTIATLQEADSGTVTFQGADVARDKQGLRKKLGYLPQEFDVYPKVNAEELLDHLAQLKGLSDRKQRRQLVEQLLVLTNLYEARKKAVATYSGGMKQRFGIAQALIGQPKLIIVDEPTAGLDPEERVRFHNLLADIGEDVTVILSTHIVSDVSDLCQHFAIINKGQVLYTGVPIEAIAKIEGKVFEKRIGRQEAREVHEESVISSHLSMGERVLRLFGEAPGAEPVPATLEDVYFIRIKGWDL